MADRSCIDCGAPIHDGGSGARVRCWPCYCASVQGQHPAWNHRGTYHGCWEWTGQLTTADGYGRVKIAGRRLLVHRLAYEATFGPIPEGLLVLHRCDNPPCWRPDHLFLGTSSDNKQDELAKGRNFQRAKTRCSAGHPFDEVNTYVTGDGARRCKTCRRDAVRRYRAKSALTIRQENP